MWTIADRGAGSSASPFSRLKSVRNLCYRFVCGTRGRRHIDLNDVVLHRVDDDIANRVKSQFTHDVAAMSFRGLRAEIEDRGDFLGALALRQELNHLALARRQLRQLRGLTLKLAVTFVEESCQHHLVNPGCEEHAIALQCFHRGYQIASCI